jgi:hypothetical protein
MAGAKLAARPERSFPMKTLPAALAALLLLASTPAFAGDHDHGDGMKDCPMHDHDLSDADRAKRMDDLFARLDADANSVIDRAEFDKHHEAMRGEHEANAPAAMPDEHAAHHEH